jgi:histone H3/H4
MLILSRRMARRGGVKRISGDVYEGMRTALKQRLEIVSSS